MRQLHQTLLPVLNPLLLILMHRRGQAATRTATDAPAPLLKPRRPRNHLACPSRHPVTAVSYKGESPGDLSHLASSREYENYSPDNEMAPLWVISPGCSGTLLDDVDGEPEEWWTGYKIQLREMLKKKRKWCRKWIIKQAFFISCFCFL